MAPTSVFCVCVLLLSGLTVSAVSVDVRPNLQQFFRGDSLSVSCADVQTDGWTVKRTRTNGYTETCGEFGRMDESFCVIDSLVPLSSGVYWCETSSRQQSDQVSITVTDDRLILDITALPVETGSDVTLRCRYRGISTVEAEFFKNGQKLTSIPVKEWTISVDHLSDEDQYSCYVPWVLSPQSRLRVKDPGSSVSVVRLFLHLLVMSPYCISTVLMVSIYCKRNTGGRAAVAMETRQQRFADEDYDDMAAGVAMETRQRHVGDEGYDDVAAGVAIEHDF
ncbi:uncharacterized protein LOC115438170 isoform X2 [Sphaeramia orbicularis]|uniref:uncharacterized protein LOC115438170 isoform X2 n=1 Tax=Sphaeramia orbicularis TaxID=375764 RepID=UPI001180B3F7|nr:uncharacterized protein LOC115438170 isoform X2 [Sphaeramia orbicularis]